MTKPGKRSLVCLCHTPPSSSCIVSIHSRFQRISLRMSGVPLPVSGRLSFTPRTGAANISQVHRSVQVAGLVVETGKLFAQVHRRPAALAVVGTHGQIPGAPVDVRPDGELPTVG